MNFSLVRNKAPVQVRALIAVIVIGTAFTFGMTATLSAEGLSFPWLGRPKPWGLPQALTDQNAEVTFELDASIHTVRGTVQGLSGRVWLENETDFRSIRAQISIPLAMMSTGNESRDRKMRRVMRAASYPTVAISVTGAELCSPEELARKTRCDGSLIGEIAISGVKQPIELPISIAMTPRGVVVSGKKQLSWRAFGIEDPSTFIATVKDPLQLNFQVRLD